MTSKDCLPPRPDEAELVGGWTDQGGKIVADETATRVLALARDWFEFVVAANGGWDRLFRDPSDGRLWELTYPLGEMHGGGPPRLAVISESDARAKYEFKA